MAGYGLGIIKVLPLPCDSPVCLVSLNFIYETMITHNLIHVPIVLVTMHKERLSVKTCLKVLALPSSLFAKYELIASPGTFFGQYLHFLFSDYPTPMCSD